MAAAKPAPVPAQYTGSSNAHSPAYLNAPLTGTVAAHHKHGSDRSSSTAVDGSGRSDASVRGVALHDDRAGNGTTIVTLSRTQLPVPTVNSNASVQAVAGPTESAPNTPASGGRRHNRPSPLVPLGKLGALQPPLQASLATPRASPLPSPCQQSLTPRTGAARPSPSFRVASQDSLRRCVSGAGGRVLRVCVCLWRWARLGALCCDVGG